MKDLQEIDWNQAKRFGGFCGAAILLLAVLAHLYQALLVPIGVSLFLTYLLAPVVDFFDRKNIPRVIAVSMILTITLFVLTFAFFKVIPSLYFEILDLVKLAPKVYDKIAHSWIPGIREVVVNWEIISLEEFDEMVQESANILHISDRVSQALTTIWRTAPQVLGTVVNIVMIPLLTFFLLKELDVIKSHISLLIPRDLEVPIYTLAKRVSDALRAVIKGQAIVAGTLAILYVLGLSLVGLHAAVAIGLFAGACRMIPYLDVLVGGALSLIVVLSDFQGVGQLIAVCIVFLVVQSVDGMLITPRVIGDRIGLHPVVVIVSILAFADLYGFWGVLLAIPVIAIARVLWNSAKPFYLASKVYDTAHPKKLTD